MDTQTKTYMPNKRRRREAKQAEKDATRERGEVAARARYVKVSPRKARLVIDTIRGKLVKEARDILRFLPQRAAQVLLKVLESAAANAENNSALDPDKLFVHLAYVDAGPMQRRFHSRAMGRAVPIRRRTSHITIVVKERGEGE